MSGPDTADTGSSPQFSAAQKIYIFALLRALKAHHKKETGKAIIWKTINQDIEDRYGWRYEHEKYFREENRILARDNHQIENVAEYINERFGKAFEALFDRSFDPFRIETDVVDFIEKKIGAKLNLDVASGLISEASVDAEQDDCTPINEENQEKSPQSPRRLIPVLGAGALASAVILALLMRGEPEPEPEVRLPVLSADNVLLETDLALQGASPTLRINFNVALPQEFYQRGEPRIAYAIDGGDETLLPPYGQADIPIRTPAPHEIAARLIFPDGSSEGPFSYPLDIAAAKAEHARAQLEGGRWLDCLEETRGMINCAIRLDALTLAAINHIRAGEDRDRLEIEVGLSAGHGDTGAVRTIPRPGQDELRLLFPPLRQLYAEPVLDGGDAAGVREVHVRPSGEDPQIFEFERADPAAPRLFATLIGTRELYSAGGYWAITLLADPLDLEATWTLHEGGQNPFSRNNGFWRIEGRYGYEFGAREALEGSPPPPLTITLKDSGGNEQTFTYTAPWAEWIGAALRKSIDIEDVFRCARGATSLFRARYIEIECSWQLKAQGSAYFQDILWGLSPDSLQSLDNFSLNPILEALEEHVYANRSVPEIIDSEEAAIALNKNRTTIASTREALKRRYQNWRSQSRSGLTFGIVEPGDSVYFQYVFLDGTKSAVIREPVHGAQ